jgi:flavin-binding protein dodecin
MSFAKATEIIASSKKSFYEAIETGIKRASKTLKGITRAWVPDQKVTVNDGKSADIASS